MDSETLINYMTDQRERLGDFHHRLSTEIEDPLQSRLLEALTTTIRLLNAELQTREKQPEHNYAAELTYTVAHSEEGWKVYFSGGAACFRNSVPYPCPEHYSLGQVLEHVQSRETGLNEFVGLW